MADNQLANLAPIESSIYPRVDALPASSEYSLYAPRGLFAHLASLRSLNLARNRLTQIKRDDLLGLKTLEVLDVRGNNLTRVLSLSKHCPRLSQLLLDSSNMACDCSVAPLLAWMRSTRALLPRANCSAPPDKRGRSLASLSAAAFNKCVAQGSLEPQVIFTGNRSEAILNENGSSNLTLRCEVALSRVPIGMTAKERIGLRPKVVWERVLPSSGPDAGQRRTITTDRVEGFPKMVVKELMTLQSGPGKTSDVRWLSVLQMWPGHILGELGSFQCVATNAYGRDSSPLVTVNVYRELLSCPLLYPSLSYLLPFKN